MFLAAFCGVFVLVLLGGSQNALALGAALLLPGLALIFKPPTSGLGRLGDCGAFGLLACLLLALIPQFYWPAADWRLEAVQVLKMKLPATLSVQPWISLEAWLMVLAGFAWFYAALQWPVNKNGRDSLFFSLSVLLWGFAGLVVWGNLMSARYPGVEDAVPFTFFPDRNQAANLLVLGGMASFAYGMRGVRRGKLLPLVGLAASGLCLTGLVLGVSRVGVLLYFLGVVIWLIASLRSHSMPRLIKFGLPLLMVALSFGLVSNERTAQSIVNFVTSDAQLSDEFRVKIYKDVTAMVLDAPISGFGLGTFPAVFPQYRDASANYQQVVHPESDFFWLASEGGLLALGFSGLFLFGYALRCRGLSEGGSGSDRILAAVAVLMFLIHGLVDVPGHRPSTVYFAILFAALALPKQTKSARFWPPRILWRVLGGVLIVIGSIWLAAGCFGLPWHSSVRLAKYQQMIAESTSVADFEGAKRASDDWLALRPLDWRAYFQRAQLALSTTGNRAEAAADFRRARFVEPVLGIVSYEEGRTWLDYDAGRAISAWRETLFRESEDLDGLYMRMLGRAEASPELQERMARLSEVDPHFRTMFLTSLREDALMGEIRLELEKDPALAAYTREQRTRIVKHWVERGDADSAEAYLKEHDDSLENSWWLWSLLLKDKAQFKEAVDYVRNNLEVPDIPEFQLGEAVLERLMREYAVRPEDVMKGTTLLYIHVENGDYDKALVIIDRILEGHKPPLYVDYWRGECLYRLQDYIESWYAFEDYIEKFSAGL